VLKSGDSRCPCFVPGLKGTFQSFPFECDVSCELCMVPCLVEEVLFPPWLLDFLFICLFAFETGS
jgi:hypothetical protein